MKGVLFMKRLFQLVCLLVLGVMISSCSDVSFNSKKGGGGNGNPTSCEPNCPPGTTYGWHESGFGLCSKPCGGGTQTQVVSCRRTIDDVVVADSLCSGVKPASSRDCNVQACTSPTYNWNIGAYGACSKTCGGGLKTRTVICQDQNGTTVADTNCSSPKPATQEACNTDACPVASYSWYVVQGPCSKQCGGGTATDTVVCKKNDGTIVADSFCDAGTKPPTNRTCNLDPCPVVYTYAWEPGSWSTCSKQCGDGIQTRSIACKRNDGAYVPENLCDAGTKPASQQACKIANCPPSGNKVTQIEYVTPALNSVDVILILDDSSSMKEDQAKLASRMSGLISDLDALKIDYQVCLTTTDISYYKGGPIKWKTINSYIMNKATANKNSIFVTTIDSLGAEWSSDEQGIKAQYLMIKDFKASGCIREKATLTTILVSDENERSVGGNQSWSSSQYKPLTAENYPDTLINFVKSTYNTSTFKKPFIYNSIIVKPGDTACEAKQDAQSSPSFFGTLYAELSSKTGGHIGSICDTDYSNSLKIIKDRTVNSMPGITLQCTPIDTPVVVFDQPITASIQVTGNTMKFTPALPEGVKVTVTYTCP
jgi:hypothetical protein